MRKIKIAVLLKQVPDIGTSVTFKEDGTLDRSTTENICNPCDLRALEMAFSIKDHIPCSVAVITMGPPSATDVLNEGLYRGADSAFLLSDPAFAGADTLATAKVLSVILTSISADIIFCGRATIDGGTSQVGPQVAEMLSIPDVCAVTSLEYKNGRLNLVRESFAGLEEVSSSQFPILITVSENAKECRSQNIRCFIEHRDGNSITTLSLRDLGISPSAVGKAGSGTQIEKVTPLEHENKERKIISEDGLDEMLRELGL